MGQFDEETIDLYSKRHSDPRLSYILSIVPRRQRHNFPVMVSGDSNPHLEMLQKKRDNFGWWFAAYCLSFTVACH